MKKFVLRIMAWLMAVAVILPVAGTVKTVNAAESHKGSTTINASGGWVEKEVTINELIGDVAPEDVTEIKFIGNVDFSVGYNNADHTWKEWSEASKSYTADDIALDGWYYFRIAITANDGNDYIVSWEVMTDATVKEETAFPAVPTATAIPTATPVPTETPESTDAPVDPAVPTATPLPTSTPKPLYTTIGDELVVTEDMVKNGIVTIVNAQYNSIVIPRDIDVDKVILNTVKAEELKVESGAVYEVSIHSGVIDTLKVNAPAVTGISRNQLLQMIKDKVVVTEDMLLQFTAYTQTMDAIANLQPKLITYGATTVEKVMVGGNVKFYANDCAINDIAVNAAEAYESLEVELYGYAGAVDVAIDRNTEDGYCLTKLNLFDSDITTVNVSGTDGSLYIAGDSDADKVQIAGANAVTVAIDAKEVTVDKKNENAKIRIYGNADNVNVAGNKNSIILSSNAKIKNADVSGDFIKIYGYGKLQNAVVTGEGANVAVPGVTVDGDNDYSVPEAMKKMSPWKDNVSKKEPKPTAKPEEEEKPEEDLKPVHTLTESGNYEFRLSDYLSDIAVQDKVKITVALSCDVYFNGTLGANTYDGSDGGVWTSAGQLDEVKTMELEIAVPSETATAMVQLWWLNEGSKTGLVIESIKVEKLEGVEKPVEPAYTGSATVVDAGGWVEYELTKAELLGDVSAGDVAYIVFSCPANIVLGYNTLDGWSQTDNAGAVSHTIDDMRLDDYFFAKVALVGNTGVEQNVTWEVYTK